MAYKSLENLLLERNRRFLIVVLIPIVALYCLLQGYVFYSEMSKTKNQMALWLARNESRIIQGLYLQNSLDIKAVVSGNREELSPQIIEVRSLRGNLLASREPFSPASAKERRKGNRGVVQLPLPLGWRVNWLSGEIIANEPLKLLDQTQGYIHLYSKYNWQNLKRESGVLFLTCMALYVLLSLAIRRLIKMLSARVVRPIQELRSEMNPAIQSLSELKAASARTEGGGYPLEVVELFDGYNRLINNVKELQQKETEYADRAAKMRIATQVAHDIRSPLMVLNMTLDEVPQISPEQKALLTSAIKRINDISNELLAENRAAVGSTLERKELGKLVGEIVEEKKLQYGQSGRNRINLRDESAGALASVKEADFKRSLSNLIDNAVEAMPKGGDVGIALCRTETRLKLTLRDEGSGIPAEVLDRILKTGGSFGKEQGNGLGIPFVKKSVESWGGEFHMESELGQGTTVSLSFPV